MKSIVRRLMRWADYHNFAGLYNWIAFSKRYGVGGK